MGRKRGLEEANSSIAGKERREKAAKHSSCSQSEAEQQDMASQASASEL